MVKFVKGLFAEETVGELQAALALAEAELKELSGRGGRLLTLVECRAIWIRKRLAEFPAQAA